LSAKPPKRGIVKESEEQYVPSSKAHVAGEALERLDIGVCSFEDD